MTISKQASEQSQPVQSIDIAMSEAEAASMYARSVSGTRVIAGGTDLMLALERGKYAPTHIIDIRRAQMNEITVVNGVLRIGATTTADELARSNVVERYAAGLWEAAATLSVPTIRNMATIGGNIANASPAADMVPPLVAMGARICTIFEGKEFRHELETLFIGPGRTHLRHGELLTAVEIPLWDENAFHHFAKLGFRDAQVIAVVSLAMSCEMNGNTVQRIGLAFGSVGPTTARAKTVEQFLIGKRLTQSVGHEALLLLEEDISPIDDIRSEAAFRLKVAKNYLSDALGRAFVHGNGADARGVSQDRHLQALKDPAPRPASMTRARTEVLGAVHKKQTQPQILRTGADAYRYRDEEMGSTKRTSMATRKKKRTTKKSSKRKTKRKTKKKTAKRKTKRKTKKKTAKRKTKRKTKKKTTKRKTKRKTKKKTAKRKTKRKTKKKTAKRKTKRKTKKKTTKRKTKRKTKKKTAKRKTKRKTKKKTAKRKTKRKTKKKTAKRKTKRKTKKKTAKRKTKRKTKKKTAKRKTKRKTRRR